MEDHVFQIQRMLANELDTYRKELNKGRVEDEEIILIKLYKVLESTSTTKSSFINDEVENLIKYMKFI